MTNSASCLLPQFKFIWNWGSEQKCSLNRAAGSERWRRTVRIWVICCAALLVVLKTLRQSKAGIPAGRFDSGPLNRKLLMSAEDRPVSSSCWSRTTANTGFFRRPWEHKTHSQRKDHHTSKARVLINQHFISWCQSQSNFMTLDTNYTHRNEEQVVHINQIKCVLPAFNMPILKNHIWSLK